MQFSSHISELPKKWFRTRMYFKNLAARVFLRSFKSKVSSFYEWVVRTFIERTKRLAPINEFRNAFRSRNKTGRGRVASLASFACFRVLPIIFQQRNDKEFQFSIFQVLPSVQCVQNRFDLHLCWMIFLTCLLYNGIWVEIATREDGWGWGWG